MPIRRGEEFLESLRDGRRVWVRGELVEDVTAHPSLKGCAQSVAAVYDLQHVPAYRDLLTMPSPVTAQPVSLAYLLPHSVEDLTRQRKMYEFLVRRAGGVAAGLPQHLATVVLGLHDVRDIRAKKIPPSRQTLPGTSSTAAKTIWPSRRFSTTHFIIEAIRSPSKNT